MEGTFVPREKPKMKLEDLKPANKKKQKMDVESQNQLKPQKEQRPAAKVHNNFKLALILFFVLDQHHCAQ